MKNDLDCLNIHHTKPSKDFGNEIYSYKNMSDAIEKIFEERRKKQQKDFLMISLPLWYLLLVYTFGLLYCFLYIIFKQ